MSVLLTLGVLSGLSLNGFLQLGLGIRHIRGDLERPIRFSLTQWGVLSLGVFLLWIVFSYILSPLSLGFLEWFLLFPLAALCCRGLEFCLARFFPVIAARARFFSAQSAYDGLAAAALLVTLRLALSPVEAAALSLGFALGGFLSALILNTVLKRSSMEAVPPALRGTPLLLISMGLLSLIASSAAAVLIRALNFF